MHVARAWLVSDECDCECKSECANVIWMECNCESYMRCIRLIYTLHDVIIDSGIRLNTLFIVCLFICTIFLVFLTHSTLFAWHLFFQNKRNWIAIKLNLMESPTRSLDSFGMCACAFFFIFTSNMNRIFFAKWVLYERGFNVSTKNATPSWWLLTWLPGFFVFSYHLRRLF